MTIQPKHIAFVKTYVSQQLTTIESITHSGSNRKYFRIHTLTGKSYILCENDNVAENRSFIYFSDLFSKYNNNIPKVLAQDPSEKAYLQQDLGDTDLLQILQQNGCTDEVFTLYEKSLTALAELQINSKNKIDYKKCYDFQKFDQKVVQNDLFYFKDYFLDRLELPYSKRNLITDIDRIAVKIQKLPGDYFLYRDFQARNILIQENKPYFIDFQGGMQGLLGYDLVSLLYQAKAQLPENWKNSLKQTYFYLFADRKKIAYEILEESFKTALIMRFFQVMGTYGLRGLVERKAHFLDSILVHLQNIEYLTQQEYLSDFPELQNIAKQLISAETKDKISFLIKS